MAGFDANLKVIARSSVPWPSHDDRTVYIEYGGFRRSVCHLAQLVQRPMIRAVRTLAEAGIRPPTLAVISEGRGVTLDPEL